MNVKPTNSGTIVQARAHVLIGSLEPICCAAWTFLNTLKSTNGPFLLDRLMVISCGIGVSPARDFGRLEACPTFLCHFQLSVSPRLAAADDGFVRRFATGAGAAALGGNARGADRMPAALGAAFAAAVRMVDRVHCGAAHIRADALPAISAGFADHYVHRVGIANLADRGPAAGGNAADFAAGKSNLG